jgi:NhaP-type Na+/H+ or K+/H+ antiporter
VFVAACVFRQYECSHEDQVKMHNFSEEAERVLVAVLMFLIGAYAVTGIFQHMTPTLWLVALAIIFVVRPAAGLIGLVGTGLPRGKRWAISFFGIRGIGSIYYLAYAVFHAEFPGAMTVWALVLAMVIISVLIHGLSARMAMQWAISASKK